MDAIDEILVARARALVAAAHGESADAVKAVSDYALLSLADVYYICVHTGCQYADELLQGFATSDPQECMQCRVSLAAADQHALLLAEYVEKYGQDDFYHREASMT